MAVSVHFFVLYRVKLLIYIFYKKRNRRKQKKSYSICFLLKRSNLNKMNTVFRFIRSSIVVRCFIHNGIKPLQLLSNCTSLFQVFSQETFIILPPPPCFFLFLMFFSLSSCDLVKHT